MRGEHREERREDDPGPKFLDWCRAVLSLQCTCHVSALEFVDPFRFTGGRIPRVVRFSKTLDFAYMW